MQHVRQLHLIHLKGLLNKPKHGTIYCNQSMPLVSFDITHPRAWGKQLPCYCCMCPTQLMPREPWRPPQQHAVCCTRGAVIRQAAFAWSSVRCLHTPLYSLPVKEQRHHRDKCMSLVSTQTDRLMASTHDKTRSCSPHYQLLFSSRSTACPQQSHLMQLNGVGSTLICWKHGAR